MSCTWIKNKNICQFDKIWINREKIIIDREENDIINDTPSDLPFLFVCAFGLLVFESVLWIFIFGAIANAVNKLST